MYNPLVTGNELRDERERRGLTQVEFAELIGVSQPRLSALESAGDETIPVLLRTMERIVAALQNGRTAEGRTSTAR